MNEDKIVGMLLKHDRDIEWIKENMVTKDDLRDVTSTLDTLVGLAEKTNQELSMVTHGMKRHEERIEVLEEDVGILKTAGGVV